MAPSEQILSKFQFSVFYAKLKCKIPDFATAMHENLLAILEKLFFW